MRLPRRIPAQKTPPSAPKHPHVPESRAGDLNDAMAPLPGNTHLEARKPPRLNDPRATFDWRRALTQLEGVQTSFAGLDGWPQVKFIIDGARVLLLNPKVFVYHEDPGALAMLRAQGLPFATIAEAKAALTGQHELPAGMYWASGRIVAGEIRKLAGGKDPELVFGSLHHRSDGFTFDLASSCAPSGLTQIRGLLERVLPKRATKLDWCPEGPTQVALAATLESKKPWRGRITRTLPRHGVAINAVYNEGTAAGRLRWFAPGTYDPTKVSKHDILVLEELPRELPPVRGVITSVFQPALAHVNLLLKNTATPNVCIEDTSRFAELRAAAKRGEAVALVVRDHRCPVEITPISDAELAHYDTLRSGNVTRLAAPTPAPASPIMTLEDLRALDTRFVSDHFGGKVAGMIELMEAGLPTMPHALAIGSAAATRHLAPLAEKMRQMFADPGFQSNADVRRMQLDELCAAIERLPVDPAVQETVLRHYREHMPSVLSEHGLRLRSSGTRGTEDAGFSGAGLYESSTWRPSEGVESLGPAIARVWASYWSFRAFDAREAAGVDHSGAGMGVLVHPNADDAITSANAVALASRRLPFQYSVDSVDLAGRRSYTLDLSAQPGAISVVSPRADDPALQYVPWIDPRDHAFPERVTIDERGNFDRTKSGASRQRQVIADDELTGLIEQMKLFLDRRSTRPHQPLDTTADFELIQVPIEWPSASTSSDKRWLFVQARPLNTRSSQLVDAPSAQGLDLFSGASKVERRVMDTQLARIAAIEVHRPGARPDQSIVAAVEVHFKAAVGGYAAGDVVKLTADEYECGHPMMHHNRTWYDLDLRLRPRDEHDPRPRRIYIDTAWSEDVRELERAQVAIEWADGVSSELEPIGMQVEVLHSSADAWVRRLLPDHAYDDYEAGWPPQEWSLFVARNTLTLP